LPFFSCLGRFSRGRRRNALGSGGHQRESGLGRRGSLARNFFEKARNRFLLIEKNFERNAQQIPLPPRSASAANKLSLRKNAAIVKDIQQKSEAARLLGKMSAGHLEVFEICNQYLSLTEKQMETVGVGSPRIAGLRRGREIVGELHRHHLLAWAEIETRALTQKAKIMLQSPKN
jgi:hypothetical protein